MFEFINRAGSIKDPVVVAGLDELMPYGNWRARLAAAEASTPEGLSPDERKGVLVEAFASNLAHFGDYKYVAETTVLRPDRLSGGRAAHRGADLAKAATTRTGRDPPGGRFKQLA